MTTLSERIRTAREQAGLAQKDVAKVLRISASAVNQWEQGVTKNMKLSSFFALARLLGQDPQWLATGDALPESRQKLVQLPKTNALSLTSDEKALLHLVRHMPSKLRKVLLRFLRGLENTYIAQPGR